MDLVRLADELRPATAPDIMQRALMLHGREAAIAFSGAEDVLLIEYAQQSGLPFRVFALDTGRLHPETYDLFERVESHYRLRIEPCFPDAAAVQRLVQGKGWFSFRQDGHQECCAIRKVAPLRAKLATLDAWITGQRRDQSATRGAVPVVQADPSFAGRGGAGMLAKWNPLANATSAEVWTAIRALGVPYNALHERGFVSIGCAPCTRAVLPGQHEREGRWWWEDAGGKECGLHKGNLDRPA